MPLLRRFTLNKTNVAKAFTPYYSSTKAEYKVHDLPKEDAINLALAILKGESDLDSIQIQTGIEKVYDPDDLIVDKTKLRRWCVDRPTQTIKYIGASDKVIKVYDYTKNT